ncbi:hypothetical protein CBR_g30791 [Chara braunii]|uniref:Uncharacterized protein n=1 Tax=Chara braunii TaxID=69332 RepID=A0A388JXE7_CHABU|nr:hypothetical protein CBR_g30791 [Chara braunii]|eukprot:GBG62470.1 hypothetical protein CBR_g30791 [Chara braunii]
MEEKPPRRNTLSRENSYSLPRFEPSLSLSVQGSSPGGSDREDLHLDNAALGQPGGGSRSGAELVVPGVKRRGRGRPRLAEDVREKHAASRADLQKRLHKIRREKMATLCRSISTHYKLKESLSQFEIVAEFVRRHGWIVDGNGSATPPVSVGSNDRLEGGLRFGGMSGSGCVQVGRGGRGGADNMGDDRDSLSQGSSDRNESASASDPDVAGAVYALANGTRGSRKVPFGGVGMGVESRLRAFGGEESSAGGGGGGGGSRKLFRIS